MRVAASVMLPAAIVLVTYLLVRKENATKELTASSGLNVLIDTLPDGSLVTLNKASSLVYPSKFKGGTRTVQLKGEAFFNVSPDREKPFIIRVDDVQVTVVGTSFNVKSKNGNTEIVVETGVVHALKGGQEIVLRAGDKTKITATDSIMTKEKVSDQLYNYYRTKEFVCDNTPLWKLVEVLNDAYKVNIVFGKNELKNLPLTSPFYNESLDQVLQVISITFNITVVQKNGQIILE